MTRIIIRAVPERAEFIDYLKEKLPSAEWCFDQKRNAMDTFLRALDMAGDDPVVHMEEDVILCESFLLDLEAAIAKRPTTLIQFFSMRSQDLTVGSRLDRNFLMGQCFYLPASYSKQIRAYYETWPNRRSHPTGLDTMVGDWLKSRKEAYWIKVPSLVNHRQCKSVIDPRRSSKRQSLTFRESNAL